MTGDFLTIEETAGILGVSTRHVRRLADTGSVVRIARGLIDRDSVDRHLHSQRKGRTRAWAEHTAWGAVAILSGLDADWLGAAQASRLRTVLRTINDADELLPRIRDRARVHSFEAHRAAVPSLRGLVATTDLRLLGISDAVGDFVDGYLAEADLADVIGALGLRADTGGAVVLRTTRFDFTVVRDLVATSAVAALDTATSTDPRLRGVGRRAIDAMLAAGR